MFPDCLGPLTAQVHPVRPIGVVRQLHGLRSQRVQEAQIGEVGLGAALGAGVVVVDVDALPVGEVVHELVARGERVATVRRQLAATRTKLTALGVAHQAAAIVERDFGEFGLALEPAGDAAHFELRHAPHPPLAQQEAAQCITIGRAHERDVGKLRLQRLLVELLRPRAVDRGVQHNGCWQPRRPERRRQAKD
eukprot:scaffold64232_cov68-Phaeocystis_antarctica.AAC.7